MDERTPGHRVTLAEGLQVGGRPAGWILGTVGVLMWVIWPAHPVAGGHWPAVRWAVTVAIAAAWIVPTFLVPVPAAARAWKWAAGLTVLAALVLGR